MRRTGWVKLIFWGIPLLAACAAGQVPSTRSGMPPTRAIPRSGASARPGAAVVTPVLTAAPQTAAPAVTAMADLPSTPPQVSFHNGMLTIVAKNATLGDILREVHRSTGATIDVPSNATERVVTRIGPGPARDVLATLLNGSTFNYVMLGSETDPTGLASVMLIMKTGGTGQNAGETTANVYQPPQQQMAQQGVMAPGTGPGGPVVQPAQPNDEEADAEEAKDEEDPAEEAQDQAQNGAVAAPDGSQPNGGPKTPEQILEMLRQRPPGQVVPGQQVIQPPQQPQNDNEQ